MNEHDEDEIMEIRFVGWEDTIDVNTDGHRLFYANNILTHNSAVEEIEFDHSHISGGISKINTADNVFGIFTSRAMRERGKYQLQCMKTRSSSGVGQKAELDFDIETLRITGSEENDPSARPSPNSIMNQIRSTSKVDPETGEIKTPIGPVKSKDKIGELLASYQKGK
jgi:hypothetical protein